MNERRKIESLRHWLANAGLDAFLLPVTDDFLGEYSADYARQVMWLTGFDGSAGLAVILAEHAALLVDGRYTLQARQEAEPSLYEVHNSGEVKLEDYLAEHLSSQTKSTYRIGFDPWLHTIRQIERWQKALEPHGIALKPLAENPIDMLWEDQPARPRAPVNVQPLDHAGHPHEAKRHEVAADIRNMRAEALLLSEPDAICWLLNIRGGDVPYNPLPLCRALLYGDGRVQLFIEPEKLGSDARAHLGHEVQALPPEALAAALQKFTAQNPLLLDPNSASYWFALQLPDEAWIEGANPVYYRRATKNLVEIEGMRRAHRIDGVAVSKCIAWFHALPRDAEPSELEVVEKLEAFRAESPDYRGPSFATIAGAGPNGAIVHYRATAKTNRVLAADDILLLDSGGQYPYGTTDITRTLVRGTPPADFRANYTRVLKGHIALATAIFPKGTTGGQLDALARQFLWQAGLDYDHGTGHGVGAYLCVHEGPQRISKRGGDVALAPGMILSNEPGYYLAGKYGIRIENLVLVVEKMPGFYGFETLTLAPLEEAAIDRAMLSAEEMAWVDAYHQRVAKELEPHV